MILLEYSRRNTGGPPASGPSSGSPSSGTPGTASKAEERKQQWTARPRAPLAWTLCTTAFVFIFTLTVEFIYARGTDKISTPVELSFTNGEIRIAKAEAADGELHRYSAKVNGKPVRFFLYRKPNGEVATVFDACTICGAIGFFKTSTGVVCKNCSAPINPQSVGSPAAATRFLCNRRFWATPL